VTDRAHQRTMLLRLGVPIAEFRAYVDALLARLMREHRGRPAAELLPVVREANALMADAMRLLVGDLPVCIGDDDVLDQAAGLARYAIDEAHERWSDSTLTVCSLGLGAVEQTCERYRRSA